MTSWKHFEEHRVLLESFDSVVGGSVGFKSLCNGDNRNILLVQIFSDDISIMLTNTATMQIISSLSNIRTIMVLLLLLLLLLLFIYLFLFVIIIIIIIIILFYFFLFFLERLFTILYLPVSDVENVISHSLVNSFYFSQAFRTCIEFSVTGTK